MNSSDYSVQNGMRYLWSSMTGDLNPERVAHLQSFLRGQEILDAGCGGGAFVEYLCAQGLRVTGVDYHEMFLEVARGRAAAKGTYVQGDVTNLPFPDKSFDTTYCFDVFEHVDDARALRELIRVTRDRILLTVPAADPDAVGGGLTFHQYRDQTHLRYYTVETLRALFTAAGQEHSQIIPELALDFYGIASSHFRPAQTSHPLKATLRNGYHRLLRSLLQYARYEVVHTGLLAIVDLRTGLASVELGARRAA